MPPTDIDKVIEKVQKLLALARDKAASEGEMEAAMQQVHAILLKYNLDLETVETKQTPYNQHNAPTDAEYDPRAYKLWHQMIACELAPLYFCKYFVQSGTNLGVIIGQPTNRVIFQQMEHYFIDTIMRMAKQAAESEFDMPFNPRFMQVTALAGAGVFINQRQGPTPNRGQPWIDAYCEGAATRLCHRFQQKVRQVQQSAPAPKETSESITDTKNALVLYKHLLQQCEDWAQQNIGDIHVQSVTTEPTDASIQGFHEADKIGLEQQISK